MTARDATTTPTGGPGPDRTLAERTPTGGTVVTGAVVRAPGGPVELLEVVVPDPGPGDVVVSIEACGVCRTDMHYLEGRVTDRFPVLLGHEGAGTVERVGSEVTTLRPGDHVVLNWRAVCGRCRSCRRGRPQYCFDTHNASRPMTLTDGTELTPALGIGAFADKTIVAAGQATRVDPAAAHDVVCLLGCGVLAGIGSVIHTGRVGPGDSVAVFGCGGVGCAAVAGARLAGATRIIAVARSDERLELATAFGATHTVNSTTSDPILAVRALTDGNGADVCIEAVGHPEVLRQAFYARDLAGTVVQVGVPDPDAAMPDLPMADFFSRGGALKPSWYGDSLPERDIPTLVELHLQGRLDLGRFVSERVGLADIESAFGRMRRGEVLRSVIVM